MIFTDMLMRLAAWLSPKDRKDWFLAMQGEYSALSQGRLGWAMGCLTTATAWRLRVDGLWLIAMFAVPVIYIFSLSSLWWQNYIWVDEHLGLPPASTLSLSLFHAHAYMPFVLFAMAMGAWHPHRVLITSSLVMTVLWIATYIHFAVVFPNGQLGYIHWSKMPPVVGEAAIWSMLAASVWVGAQIGLRVSRPRPHTK